MKIRLRVPLIFLILLLVPASTWAQQIEQSEDGFTATVTKSFAVDPGGTFDLEATNGSITVSSWDRNEVAVEETIQFSDASRSDVEEYLKNKATSYETTNGTVRVRGPENNNGGWSWFGGDSDDVQYEYEVQVPRRFSARLRTSGGSLDVSKLEGTVNGQTAGGSVTAQDIAGDVQVQTAGGSVTLRAIDGSAEGETAGGSIEAVDVSGPLNVRTAGGSIRVESAGDSVSAETAGGSIEVDGAEGNLIARTSGGDVRVRGVMQTVEAETSGGDIELEDIGGRVTAETSGGDIGGRGLRMAVKARTSAGDIELQDVRAAVTAETSVGDIVIESTAQEYATDPAFQLTTSHGDITLTVPSGLQASFRAEVQGYGGRGQDEIRSDVPLTRKGGDGDPIRAQGDMNGGGPQIQLETTGGSIQIRTSGE